MLDKLVMGMGLLGVGGYVGYTVMNHDPAVYPYSKVQVEEMLGTSELKMPRRTKDGEMRMWGDGTSDRGVALRMTYNNDDASTPVLACEAVLTVVEPAKTRVTADCAAPTSGSAIADTTLALRTPMFAEYIDAVLQRRAFDRQNVENAQSALVMKNMGGMQREALKRADEAQRERSSGN